MAAMRLDDMPGFRRRFVVEASAGRVRSAVEDDYHCMSVSVEHENGVATAVTAEMTRVPWTTCPGAPAVVERTFTGVPLANFVARGEKQTNCTHLHDLALLAAAHAEDDGMLVYDMLVSDPVEGESHAELRRDGAAVLGWSLKGFEIVAPAELAGTRLDKLRGWIETLDSDHQEYARLLRWGTILAHGRISAGTQRSASDLPVGQCHTFQPENAAHAVHIPSTVRDFSGGKDGPLAKYGAGSPAPAKRVTAIHN